MKKILCALAFVITSLGIIGCGKVTEQRTALPRIAIAGLAIESSTFSPALTHEEAFHARVGDTILTSYEFLARDSADPAWQDYCPNAATLMALNALPWRARREW